MFSQDINEASSSQYFCRKCRCDGIYFPVKGHKAYCDYKSCECSKCYRVPRRSRKSVTVESKEDEVVLVWDKGEVLSKSSEGQGIQQEDKKREPLSQQNTPARHSDLHIMKNLQDASRLEFHFKDNAFVNMNL